jgi:hypothetical protein
MTLRISRGVAGARSAAAGCMARSDGTLNPLEESGSFLKKRTKKLLELGFGL